MRFFSQRHTNRHRDSKESFQQPSVDARGLRHSLKWKILTTALLSVAGLLSFVGLMVYDSHLKAEQLRDFHQHRYPAQAQLLSAVHTLEFIHRELETAVITGDEDVIASTQPLTEKFRTSLYTVVELNTEYQNEVAPLLVSFDEYYKRASVLAVKFINPFGLHENLAMEGRQNAIDYQTLMARLNQFQLQRNIDFTRSINDTTTRARETVSLAITSGLIVVGLVLSLALLTANGIIRRIRDMVDTLKRIATDDSDMKARIKISGHDEMAELAHWFNSFIEKLDETTLQATRDVWHIAHTDALSGLPNRRFLTEWIRTQGSVNSETYSDFSVLFLDLDDFKPINDQLGHEAGDKLIAEVAVRLQDVVNGRALNANDKTLHSDSDRGIVGRLGGDEFMIVLPGLSNTASVEAIACSVLAALTEPYLINGVKCTIGTSIGVSRFPNDGTDRGEVLDKADKAMYEAKSAGKNQYLFYNQQMASELSFNSRLEQLLKSVDVTQEFHLLYQAKVSLHDGETSGAEALIRWHSKELGEISPAVFIEFAEQRNLIRNIDHWVIQNVCVQIGCWQQAGIHTGCISINISAISMQEKWLPELIAAEITGNNISAEDIEIEITESSVIEINDNLMDNISKLRQIGVRIAMDDFGAGHSSLRLLMDNNVDVLKIDKSLIDNIELDTRHQKIVQSIIALADTLGVDTLAEGIETSGQWNCLRRIGCRYGQGFLFSRPLLPLEFENTYLRHHYRRASGE